MITEIAGVRVGHWTDPVAKTGCTAILFPPGTVASGEIRGGAPATREFALLDPQNMVQRLDALVLTGGSAFGLASADGVVNVLEAQGVGFETAAGVVPIVVALGLFDLGEGDATVRPSAGAGRHAAESATASPVDLGRVGAGTGATVSKWRSRDLVQPGGLGAAIVRSGDVVVAALMAVNASGDIDDGSTHRAISEGTFDPPSATPFGENTTIGVVVTNARLTKAECHLVAQSAHDGFARALVPAHTAGDGDAVVVAATGTVDAAVLTVRVLATVATEQAIGSVPG